MASRNQREGKFIPGWCLNPSYKFSKRTNSYEVKFRAGKDYNLKGYRNYFDGHAVIPGVTFVRSLREEVFQ